MSISAIWTSALLALLLLFPCFVVAAQADECYFPDRNYTFSTPCKDSWEYKWTATDGTFVDGKDDNCTINWTAPMVGSKTNVTLYVTVANNVTVGELNESCIDMDDFNLTVCPLGSITIIKNAEPDWPQNFTFTTDLGDFDLEDYGASPANSKTFYDLLPGSYVINETVLDCWNLSDIRCEGNASVEFGNGTSFHKDYAPGDTSVMITLQPGNISICTFNNTKKPAAIKVVKTANYDENNPVLNPGTNITYWINVTNVGEVNLTNVNVTDLKLSLNNVTFSDDLGVGVSVNKTYYYNVNDSDLCDYIKNYVRVNATNPCDNAVVSDADEWSIRTNISQSFDINKTANVSTVGVGGVINYTIIVTNTGNVNATEIKVTDELTSGSNPHLMKNWTIPKLAPGENVTLDMNYTVTEDDLIGTIENVATVGSFDGPCGGRDANVESNVTVDTEYNASLEVKKTADYGPCPANPAGPGTNITYKINVTNTGDVNLSNVLITDLMLLLDGHLITGLLGPGESVEEQFYHIVNESDLCEPIINVVEANASVRLTLDQEIEYVNDTDSWCVNTTYNATMNITKTANRTEAYLGDVIGYEIIVNNTGNVNITDIEIIDSIAEPGHWGPFDLAPGENKIVDDATYTVTEDDVKNGSINNTARAVGQGPCGPVDPVVATEIVNVISLAEFDVRKVALNKTVKRGEEITYLIQIKTDFSVLHNVVVKDVFNKRVEFVFASPMPDADGIWRFDKVVVGSLAPDEDDPEWRTLIVLKVKVPEPQDFEFDMGQGVAGEGFVNVANDYSTTLQSFVITNCIYITTEETGAKVYSDCESVTVSYDPGTELSTREHGSGLYESEELVRMRTENKSISMDKDMAATYKSTTLGLYNNRTVKYSSRWTEEANAKNRVTGASMSEQYRYANIIDRESSFFLDKNESVMDISTEFDGMGHIGFLKMPTNTSTPHATPSFESREDYTGSFKILERIDEYGSSVTSEKSASGDGLVTADKRIGESQRSYESGTGSYDSEEIIETNTNYIAKDISLVYAPMSQSLIGDVSIEASQKWKEGMYSKTPGISYIGEEYTSITELDKETVARGLNEMDTEVDFSGRARYRAVLEDEVDYDEQYEGDYSIERRILFTGVPKYDRPHLSVTKTLDEIVDETLPWGYNETHLAGETKTRKVATYTITIENDGSSALGPIYVQDFFPPGSSFIEPSSVRPTELAETYANWTLTHLAIGDVSVITLKLDVTKYYPDELTNRVEVCGGYNDEWVCAYNFSAQEVDWLSCCPNETVSVSKTAELDQENQNIVWYRIDISNMDDVTRTATVTDSLPDGMVLLDTSVPFASYDENVVVWNLIEIGPRETATIAYRVEAQMAGRFRNSVEVDARSVNGPVVLPVYASSVIDIGEVEECGATSCTGWSPPNWDFEYVSSSGGASCEDLACDDNVGLVP